MSSTFQFNSVLLGISDQLSSAQLDGLKFLCKDIVGKRDLEKTTRGTELFRFLTERQKLGHGNTEFLCGLLEHIQRPDLADRLRSLESPSGPGDDQPDDAETAKLTIASGVIAGSLGKSWRKLGRKLGLKEVKLDTIQNRHPTDLEEVTLEMLKEWRKVRGAGARTQELIDALRACQLNMTADTVEDRLEDQDLRSRRVD